MKTTVITIPAERIIDWNSFHSVFKETLGFPDFYGRNMNAWIDCMGDVDDANAGTDEGMTTRVAVKKGDLLAMRIDNVDDFASRCPEQYQALLECTAFVNSRRVAQGDPPVLTILASGWFRKNE